MMHLSRGRGFTLVELMIVIAIIGILAAALFPAMTGYLQRARDANRIASLTNVKAVLQTYNSERGGYYPDPISQTCLSNSTGGVSSTEFQQMFGAKKAPVDPQGSMQTMNCPTRPSYGYAVIANSGSYLLWANMETPPKANVAAPSFPNITPTGTGFTPTPTTGSQTGVYMVSP